MEEMNKQAGKQWYKYTSLQQAVGLLITAMVGLNGYKGPVFDNWVGDLIALAMMVIILFYIRKEDNRHLESKDTISVRYKELEIERLTLDIQFTQLEMAKAHG